MEFLNFVLQKFEVAFQKHEKEVVIELAIDRILTFIGVHVLLGLAGLFKVSEVVGTTFNLFDDNIACYPHKTNSTPKRSFMMHANKFCWESTVGNYTPHHTNITSKGYDLLDDSIAVKDLYKILPYLLITEAAMLALPGVYWNITVGPRLSGLLKFMLHFLDDVYNSLKNILAGEYRRQPYDKDGNYLDGWRKFSPRYKTQHQGMADQTQKKYKKKPKPVVSYRIDASEVVQRMIKSDFIDEEDSESKPTKSATHQNKSPSLFFKDIYDRHIFSMLCYENFASLSYHPYIMAVEALTATPSALGHRKGIVPLKKGILGQLCHEKNFKGKYLANCYMKRYTLSILLSSILVIGSWTIFAVYFIPTFKTKVFPCFVPTSPVMLLCVLKKHWDITALYLINTFVLTAHLMLSIYQLIFVGFGSQRGMCYFFEDVADSSSLALQVAARAEAKMERRR